MGIPVLLMLVSLCGLQEVPMEPLDPLQPVVMVQETPDCVKLQAGFAEVEQALDKLEMLEGPVDPEGD
jgi:hypothetical protein